MDQTKWVILIALTHRLTASKVSRYEAALGCLALERLFPECVSSAGAVTASDEIWVNNVHTRLREIWKHGVDYPDEYKDMFGDIAETIWSHHDLSEKIVVKTELEALLKAHEEMERGIHARENERGDS